MKFKISYSLVVIFSLISLFGFSKMKKRKVKFNMGKYNYLLHYSFPEDTSTYTVSYSASNQPKILIHIVDALSKEDLIGVNFVYYEIKNQFLKGDISDIDGKIELKANSKINKLVFSYIGYSGLNINPSVIDSTKNNHIFISLGWQKTDDPFSLNCKHKHNDSELKIILKELVQNTYIKPNQQKIDSCDCRLSIII